MEKKQKEGPGAVLARVVLAGLKKMSPEAYSQYSADLEGLSADLEKDLPRALEQVSAGYGYLLTEIRRKLLVTGRPEDLIRECILTPGAFEACLEGNAFEQALAEERNFAHILGFSEEACQELCAAALRLYEQGHYKEAQAAYAFLVLILPQCLGVVFGFAESSESILEWDKALEGFGMAIALRPVDIQPYYRFVQCALDAGLPDRAEAAAKLAVEMADKEVEKDESFKKRACELQRHLQQIRSTN